MTIIIRKQPPFLLPFLILMVIGFATSAQSTPIGLGWARNSVNSPVFRKNAVTNFKGHQFASYYDAQGYVVLAKRELDAASWQTNTTQYKGNVNDAHNSISIAVDGNGYLHMAWDHHGHPLRYCMSTDSFGITMGSKKSMVGSLEGTVTYPEFFRMPNGNLTFIYRDGWSGNANCVINTYNAKQKKWIRLHNNLISGQNARSAYWQSCVDKNGVIHISWVWRETADVASNHDMCYAKSTDGGITWTKSTGELYEIPIKASTAEYIYSIPQNSELINQTSIYATSNSVPYIATYWTDAVTKRPQYQLIFQDEEGEWQHKTMSNRKSSFSLSGGGTKKIPISRPQVMVDDRSNKPVVYMLYRDNDRGSKVSMNVCSTIDADTIDVIQYDITDFSVGDWEPTYDTDLWKDSFKLDIFVQRMEQGDGETLSNLSPQPVYVWRVQDQLTSTDTIQTPALVVGRPSRPFPRSGTKNVGVDTTLTWTGGANAEYHQVLMGLSAYDLEWVANVDVNYYKPESLLPATKYYWQIKAIMGDDVNASGAWFFTTEENTSSNKVVNTPELNLFPQPANQTLYLKNIAAASAFTIYDKDGKACLSGNTSGPINISQLNDGFYLLQIDNNRSIKFIKKG